MPTDDLKLISDGAKTIAEEILHVVPQKGNRDPLEDLTGELPPALVKAIFDPFDYVLGLRDGRIIHFQEAKLCGSNKWVNLFGNGHGFKNEGAIEVTGIDHEFPRGINVRISDIMWVADAPNGS
jgi:hypothetical protein